jgi:hypothetical protein
MTKIFFEETWTTVRDNVFSYDPYQVTSAIGSCLLVPVLVNYLFLVFRYHRGHKLEDHTKGQTPPEYPFFIPSIGPLGSIWLDHAGFLRRLSYVVVTSHAHEQRGHSTNALAHIGPTLAG